MPDEDFVREPRAPASTTLPFYYHKKTSANGESDEICLGPSVVYIFRSTVWLIIVGILIVFGVVQPPALLKFLPRLFP
jgi:hypothetical protein